MNRIQAASAYDKGNTIEFLNMYNKWQKVTSTAYFNDMYDGYEYRLAEQPKVAAVDGAKRQPHKHAEVIKAWADGAEIEVRSRLYPNWSPIDDPRWIDECEYRVKPPREFPKSSLTGQQAYDMYYTSVAHTGVSVYDGMKAVADAAVKQYILDTEAAGK